MAAGVVGRDGELALLEDELDRALAGAGRVVVVAGEPGIGKTTLAAAVGARATAAGVAVAWGRATEHDGAPPFWPWRQVVAALGGADPLDAPAGADPAADRFARFAATADWVAERAAPAGALVVLDDVHRADPASLWLLAHVAGTIHDARVLVLATTRTTPADRVDGADAALAALARTPTMRRIDLGGLDREGVAAVLGPAVDAAVVDLVAGRSGGNPLYVGELARHLADGGPLGAVPASVREAVMARLAARPADAAEVLRTASVVGRTFSAGLVATATGRPVLDVLRGVDDAVAAGLVEPEGVPGRFRFVHVLVRDAIESSLGAAELAVEHRRVAEAIEAYDGAEPDRLADLARHWDAASALGGHAITAGWAERAADAALRDLAWEEAVRLYDRAVDLDGAADPVARHRRLLGSARARLHCDRVGAAVERCVAAARAVEGIGRADLVAEAALVVEGRGDGAREGFALAEAALAELGPDDPVLAARLLGQAASLAFYADPRRLDALSAAALVAADATGDTQAAAAAARARQMARVGPDGLEERLDLAGRIGAAGRSLGRPAVAMWEPIWRFDALVELGRLADAADELATFRDLAQRTRMPLVRWHVAAKEALLAQATGRLAEGLAAADEAHDLFAALEDPIAAQAIRLGYRMAHAQLAGAADLQVADWDPFRHGAPPFLGDLPLFGPALTMAWHGDLDGAAALYDRLAPAASWATPPHLFLHLRSLRVALGRVLGRSDDLAALADQLAPWRDRHVGSGGGAVSYVGPVAVWIGVAQAGAGQLDDAVRALDEAAAAARRNGARPWAVVADVELADALDARRHGDDLARARALRTAARPVAAQLGMAPWIARLDAGDRAAAAPTAAAGPLSPRELEVAALVAAGRTNREIAAELHISDRTAQNHVQHILTKLDLANRTQIATWFTSR